MNKIIALVAAAALVASPVSFAQEPVGGAGGAGVSAAQIAAGGTFAFSQAVLAIVIGLGVAYTVTIKDDKAVIIVPPPPPPPTTTTTTTN